jgi:D-alanine-D-alanine ligase
LLVKSLTEEGSVGIARASLVHDVEQLEERTRFVHRQLGTDAIAEQFISGRELYVGILGNQRLQVFPVWELLFTNVNGEVPLIATAKVKWDPKYQKKLGVKTQAAQDLPDALRQRIIRTCKRAYRVLNLSGYARIDLRLQPDGSFYVLEANPNPQLAYGEDFAESAEAGGVSYERLLQRIMTLGMSYRAEWKQG